ncbi:cyclin-dependent kinase inhibitor 4-like [Phragmites australis]|uniref:cyclin-dependent kinase inhibitor 4-like n=1 Tax=Phragmites australis TaxID=29695 RepID=UPI002D7703FB|nr:cyclin-dependent kinase inhibitor 4-like [Phragmites australis]
MGKYMRKAKVSGEVAVMEVAAAPLGVRTRARALALQRLQKQQPQGEEKGGAGGEYLELRSRRLEKLPPPPAAVRRCGGRKAATAVAAAQEETEASFGENVLELEAMDRSTRETTPCSLIRDSETISTPGSTTRPSHSNSHHRVQAPVRRTIPSSAQMDEFFAAEERRQQQAFIDKYNFDPVNDCPLPGRYEWVKLY